MSCITKGGPLRLFSKRNYSMVLNPELANSALQSQQNLQEDLIQPKHQQLSVKQFANRSHKHFTFPSFKEPVKKSIPLIPENVQTGYQIRKALQRKHNYDELLLIVKNITETRNFSVITEGLQREEIGVLLLELVEGQETRICEYNNLRITLDLDDQNEILENLLETSHTLTNFYLGLLAMNFKFTTTELYLLLKLESNNYRYDRAADLINYIDRSSIGIPRSSRYWNYKLRILGDANPGFWTVLNKENQKVRLSKRAFREDLEKRINFGELMNQLSQDLGSMIPNLETHCLIITSAGKENQLELIESQIKNLWGIGQDDISYENIVEPNSPIYPNIHLLRHIVAAYAVNNQYNVGIKYLTNFQTAYKIDMTDQVFWKELFNWAEATLHKEDGSYSKIMESLWNVMQSNSPNFHIQLTEKRSVFLFEQERLKDLVDLTLQSRLDISNFFEAFKLDQSKVLLKRLYQRCCSITFAQNSEDSIDLVKLYNTLALDSQHEQELEQIYALELEHSSQKRKRFQAIQEEYDEEDDENSLW